jgi:hypothetical protein
MSGTSIRLPPWPALAVLVVACVTTPMGAKVTERKFEFSSYSVDAPEGGDWGVVELDPRAERVVFQQATVHVVSGRVMGTFLVHVFRVPVAPEGWGKSEEEHATAYRDNEERIMNEQGVQKGRYTLKNVRKGVETVGGKKLYFMHYETVSGTWFSGKTETESVLYLYFPPDYYPAQHAFFGFLTSVADGSSSAVLKQVEPVIASFKLRQPLPQ